MLHACLAMAAHPPKVRNIDMVMIYMHFHMQMQCAFCALCETNIGAKGNVLSCLNQAAIMFCKTSRRCTIAQKCLKVTASAKPFMQHNKNDGSVPIIGSCPTCFAIEGCSYQKRTH